MLRGEALVLACALGACGRVGFGGEPAATEKPDAAPLADADPTIDAPVGTGTYAVTESMQPYALLDAGTVLPDFVPGSDEDLHSLALPFTFTFYGIPYDTISIHTNGYIGFGAPAASPETYQNDCPIDASAPDAIIASFWDDLFASKKITPFGTIRHALGGTAPDRSVEIEWHDLDAYYRAGTGTIFFSHGIRITQKVVLHETGVIDLHYGPRTGSSTTKDCGTDRHLGCSATVGLRAPSSAVTHTVQCGTDLGEQTNFAPLVEGRLITFTPS